jgi:YbbR domain-containing protein
MKKIWEKTKKVIISKSFWGSIVFALSLWIYTSLKGDFTTILKVPVRVLLPSDRAIDSTFISSIPVEVKGSGWILFNMLYLNTSSVCLIDLTDENITSHSTDVLKGDLMKSLQLSSSVQSTNIMIDKVTISTIDVKQERLSIKSNIRIYPKEHFIVVGNIKMTPDSVTVRGNRRLLSNLTNWQTKTLEIDNVYKPFSLIVPLSDTLKNMLNLSENSVKVDVQVEQRASLTIPAINIQLRGGNESEERVFQPRYLAVTITGGISKIADFQIENIRAFIDFNDLENDSTGIIIPKIIAPDYVKVTKVEPSYIHYTKRIKT